jgi:hypothetical protein
MSALTLNFEHCLHLIFRVITKFRTPSIFHQDLSGFTSLTDYYNPFNGMNSDVMTVKAQLITFSFIAACASAFFSRETRSSLGCT